MTCRSTDAKVGLSLASEDLSDRAPFARFDEQIHVFRAPAELPRKGLRQCRLTCSHESDEINLVRLQEGTSLGEGFESGEELGIGDGDRVGPADDRMAHPLPGRR